MRIKATPVQAGLSFSYDALVTLSGHSNIFGVRWASPPRGDNSRDTGTLISGQSLTVEDGTVVYVIDGTNRS